MNESVTPVNISFVIPAYNAEKTLSEAVNSIFDGNFEDSGTGVSDEIIIVDDGSTDDTRKVAEMLAIEYGSQVVFIVNPENKGCPASRNVGIARAKNQLIFNLDSDNVLPQGSIKSLREGIVRENADVAAFQEYRYFKDSTSKITHRWVCASGSFTLTDILGGTVNPAPGGNFLYRRAVWERIGGYDEYGKGLHEAWGFSLKLLANGAKFIVIPDTYYFHRYSHESLFVRESKKKDEAADVTNKFIAPIIPRLDWSSQNYVARTPDWFDRLDIPPLHLADDTSVPKEGIIVFSSTIRQAVYSFLRLMKRVSR